MPKRSNDHDSKHVCEGHSPHARPKSIKVELKFTALLPTESEPPASLLTTRCQKAWRDSRRKLQPGKSNLKQVGATSCAKEVKFRLTKENEYCCRLRERRSSRERYFGSKDTINRTGRKMVRYSPATLKSSAAQARRTANLLAKSCGRLSGNAKAAACPATGKTKLGRNFLLDSGASFNVIGRDELTLAELKTLKVQKN